jgi:hypothetical protein
MSFTQSGANISTNREKRARTRHGVSSLQIKKPSPSKSGV